MAHSPSNATGELQLGMKKRYFDVLESLSHTIKEEAGNMGGLRGGGRGIGEPQSTGRPAAV